MATEERGPAPDRAGATAPRPWATIGLIAVLVIIWLAMTITGRSFHATENEEVLVAWGAQVRPDLWLKGQFWRLFTANFLHLGFLHLAVNSLSLWWMGQAVEVLFGPWQMLYIFVLSGIAGSAASALFGLPMVLSAGASGAIFGLLGAVIWYRVASPLGYRIPWRSLLFTLALNAGLGLALYQMVDNWNHLGGLLGGAVAAAAVGIPVLPGLPLPRLHLGPACRGTAMMLTVVLAGMLVTGIVALPGPGRDLARAITLYQQDRPAEAEAGFRRALRREPDEPGLHLWLAGALGAQSKCPEAVAEADKAAALAPGDPEVTLLQRELAGCK